LAIELLELRSHAKRLETATDWDVPCEFRRHVDVAVFRVHSDVVSHVGT
jgi:hypothetical protein